MSEELRPACLIDPELMFPIDEREIGSPSPGERRALAQCSICPLLRPCRTWALETRLPYGVAGGLTRAQRRVVLRLDSPTPAAGPRYRDPLETVLAATRHHEGGRRADPVAVLEVIAGSHVDASRWEVALAAMVMIEAGHPKLRISRWLDVPSRHLYRWWGRYRSGTPLVVQETDDASTSGVIGRHDSAVAAG